MSATFLEAEPRKDCEQVKFSIEALPLASPHVSRGAKRVLRV